MKDYVEALCNELRMRAQEQGGRPLQTVYFGGGTPSMLPLPLMERIVETIRRNYDTSALVEATVEANPEDLDEEQLAGLQWMGFFDRLSVGIQSFHDDDLRRLRRRHTAHQAIDALLRAANHGFHNISIDLIYGLPVQNLDAWKDNLEQLRQIDPDHQFIRHLSCYALTIEPHTMLARQVERGEIVPADEESVLRQYEALTDWCAANGFEQYEISNFCKPGFPSRHNSRYWDRTPYIGVGAAAHSFDGCHRRWNVANVAQYIEGVATGEELYEQETLTEAEAFNEYLMTALRTPTGIEKKQIPEKFYGDLQKAIQKYIAAGLIVDSGSHFRPTQAGLLQADGIAADLFH